MNALLYLSAWLLLLVTPYLLLVCSFPKVKELKDINEEIPSVIQTLSTPALL